MNDQSMELVSILVPKQHLSRIYGYISTLDSPNTTNGTVGEPEDSPEWTPDLVRRQYVESPDIMKRLDTIFPGPGGPAPEAYAW